MNKYIQQSENHITHVDKMVPPHKEHGEWGSEFDYKFVTVCPDKKHPLYGKEVLNPIYPDVIKDFIHKLLLSTQQEAVEKERERVKEIVTNPPKDLVVKYGDYDDLDVWSVDWQRYILDSLTPKETV